MIKTDENGNQYLSPIMIIVVAVILFFAVFGIYVAALSFGFVGAIGYIVIMGLVCCWTDKIV